MSPVSADGLRARMRALEPEARAELTAKLAARGLLHHLDGGPERAEGEPRALSVKQEALWRLHQGGDDGDFHHVGIVYEFAPATTPDHLATAWARAAAHHETLRTSYGPDEDGRVVPRLHPEPPRPELTTAPGAESQDAASALRYALGLAREDGRRPFALEAPPLRVRLVDARPAALLLALTAHDLACDRYGLRTVLLPELCGLPVRAELRPGDVARWQRESLSHGLVGEQLRARREDGGPGSLLAFPGSGDRAGARIPVRLEAEVSDGLRRLAKASRAGLFAVVLAAWGGVVAAHHGSAEVAVGCCTSGRHRPELEGVLANLANTLLVRVPAATDPASASASATRQSAEAEAEAERLELVRRRLVEAMGAADVPFERLLEESGGPPPPRRDEEAGVRLTLDEPQPSAEAAGPGSGLAEGAPRCTGAADVDFGYAKCGLDLQLDATGTELTGHLAYRPAVVARETAQELSRTLLRHLTALAGPPAPALR